MTSKTTHQKNLSSFTHLFQKESVGAFFHSLNFEVIFMDSELSELISESEFPLISDNYRTQVPGNRVDDYLEAYKKMKKMGIICEDKDKEERKFQKTKQHLFTGPKIDVMYLLLSDQCNFKCTYCFVEKPIPKGYTFSNMSVNTARAAIMGFEAILRKQSSIDKYNSSSPSIIFYGGEPLLNIETFKFAIKYIQDCKRNGKLPDKTQISVVTNGSRIDSELTNFIKNFEISISVSIDGFESLHDKARISQEETGTFQDALNGYKLLQGSGISPSISCTIGEHNVDKIPEINRWFVEDLGVKGLGYNLPMYDLENPNVNEIVERGADQLIECYEFNRKHGVYEDRIMRKVNSFVNKKIHINDCAGCGNQLVIAPNGDVGICHAYVGSKKYFNLSVEELADFEPKNDKSFIEWSRRSPINTPECQNCSALGICGGGCPYSAEIKCGSIWGVDERYCKHSLKSLDWLIWDLYSNSSRNQMEL